MSQTKQMSRTTPASDSVADRELVLERVFSAPRELVFDAWTDPAHIAEWWGPQGFTTTIGQMEVRPGGIWRFVMHGPDGVDYLNEVIYEEIARPERLVYTHGPGTVGRVGDLQAFHVTVTFAQQAELTKVTLRTRFASAEELAKQKAMGAVEGGYSTMQRLAEYLAAVKPPQSLTLTRLFDAPRDLVFKAWTDPKHLAQWWGPGGFTVPLCEVDLRPGGAILIHMRGPDGTVFPMRGVWNEVVEPERLVMTNYPIEDESGQPLLEVQQTVTFAEQDNQTLLTLHVVVVKAAIPIAAGPLGGMAEGWTQSLARLAAHLAQAV
jgi:uncharacterized protein YndB with AHSA1/START domain